MREPDQNHGAHHDASYDASSRVSCGGRQRGRRACRNAVAARSPISAADAAEVAGSVLASKRACLYRVRPPRRPRRCDQRCAPLLLLADRRQAVQVARASRGLRPPQDRARDPRHNLIALPTSVGSSLASPRSSSARRSPSSPLRRRRLSLRGRPRPSSGRLRRRPRRATRGRRRWAGPSPGHRAVVPIGHGPRRKKEFDFLNSSPVAHKGTQRYTKVFAPCARHE